MNAGNSVSEIKKLFQQLNREYAENDLLKKDLEWYSENHYTTSGEYLGEAGLFISSLIDRKLFPQYEKKLNSIKKCINTVFNTL